MSINAADLLQFLKDLPSPARKKDIADAFQLKGDNRIILKNLLRILTEQGQIVRQPGGGYSVPDALPDIMTVEISGYDENGNLIAIIPQWEEEHTYKMPLITVIGIQSKGHKAHNERAGTSKPRNKTDDADNADSGKVSVPLGMDALIPARGDRALARLSRIADGNYEATLLRMLAVPQARVMGVVEHSRNNFRLKPVSRKAKFDYILPASQLNGAKEGDVVTGEIQPRTHKRSRHEKTARVLEVVGRREDPAAISRISLNEEGLREEFSRPVLEETRALKVPPLRQKSGPPREDLRSLPLVTIDGADARDFDDAVFARPEDNGTYHIIVAIADVAYYVRPGSKLDIEAWTRGNSTYFPDKVVPMLPEALSNDLCSLRPDEDRACLAVHMWISEKGDLLNYKFVRALMRSHARLTYEVAQQAADGKKLDSHPSLAEEVVRPLFDAYAILRRAREKRGALDIEMPERKILIDERGQMIGVEKRERLDAHMMIEELMILANVAAARALEKKNAPCIYRVHDLPDMNKLVNARNFLLSLGLQMKKGTIDRAGQLNGILRHVSEHPCRDLVNEVILRAQSSALYSPGNIGHFGLDLEKYAHFTSPIRRYADLFVHRSLIQAYNLGPGGLSDEEKSRIDETCRHISETERASMIAERNAVDRFAAHYLSRQPPEQIYKGRVRSVTGFGLFVTLEETGVDGLVPIRTLGGDYFHHDEMLHALIGTRTGVVFRVGGQVDVRVKESDPLTGSAVFEILSPEKGAEPEGYEIDSDSYKVPGRGKGRNGRPGKKKKARSNSENTGKKKTRRRTRKPSS